MIKKVCSLFVFLALFVSLNAQSVIGQWKTIDDETGEAKSYVQLYEQNGKIYGKITKLLQKDEKTTFCTACHDHRKGQLIHGMVILQDLQKDGRYYRKGEILDPENGKIYNCKIWLDTKNSNKLYVRGYLGPFYRTQQWYRVIE